MTMTTAKWEPLGPGIYHDVPETIYHSDPCEVPSLSSSLARVITRESAQHAWHLHPRLGGKTRKAGKAALDGQILHALSLGQPLPSGLVIVEHADFRTKAAKEERDAAIAAGNTPMSRTEFDRLRTQARELREQQERDAEVVRETMAAGGAVYGGEPEVTIIWPEESFHGTVLCRARLDRLDLEHGIIHDLKRVDSAAPDVVGKKIAQWGYHIQAAAYMRALSYHLPHLTPRFLLHFVEGAPVYGYTPTELDADYLAIGEALWLRAVEAFGRGIHRGEWPAYVQPGAVHTVHPKPYQFETDEEEDEAA